MTLMQIGIRCLGCVVWLAASSLRLAGASLGPTDLSQGGDQAVSMDGRLALIPSAGFGVGPDYFGVAGVGAPDVMLEANPAVAGQVIDHF
jgi:hypothetical protein